MFASLTFTVMVAAKESCASNSSRIAAMGSFPASLCIFSLFGKVLLLVDFLGPDFGLEVPYHALYGFLLGLEEVGDFEHLHYAVLLVAQVDLYFCQLITLAVGRLALSHTMIKEYINTSKIFCNIK
jgi:hypothetical protein